MDIYTARRTWDLGPYLDGTRLYGDDYTPEQLKQWYAEEEYAYFQLTESVGEYDVGEDGRFVSKALNDYLFGGVVDGKRYPVCVGFGSAEGRELEQFAPQVDRFEVVEPADQWHVKELYGRPVRAHKPAPSGQLPFKDESVDMVVCFSTMHHVANAGFVFAEFSRVLKPGGLLLLREPIVSMGDWRYPRHQLTPNERGLPLPWLRKTLDGCGFKVERQRYCVFRPWHLLVERLFKLKMPYASRWYMLGDALFSRLMAWNVVYHRTTWWEKMAPSSVGIVARKA